jgi:hypothetical protein
MKKTCILSALPLILSLAIIPTTQALAKQPDWSVVGSTRYGRLVLMPHGSAEQRMDMREMDRSFAPPAAMAPSHSQTRDPFADLHLE